MDFSKIFWISDTHLDFASEEKLTRFLEKISLACCEPDSMLFCTGDITISSEIVSHVSKLAEACKGRFFYVLGNHDYWGGSFASVEDDLLQLQQQDKMARATFMDASPPVELEKNTFIVGDSGWYDGRNGLQGNPQMILNDWYNIRDMVGHNPYKICPTIADPRVAKLSYKLEQALKAGAKRIIVLTHVPPFVNSCRYNGRPSDNYALPWFSSQVMADMLEQFVHEHWKVKLEVLCGHTHDQYVYKHKDNLVVHVAGAKYYDPQIVSWQPTLWK